MSAFSECLKKAVSKANISIVRLSALSGVERSYIQKMLGDNRIPAEERTVLLLAQGLSLSSREENDMLEAYRMTKLGAEVYYQRQDIGELLRCFDERTECRQPLVVSEGNVKLELPGNINVIRGRAHVLEAVRALFSQEADREGDICIVCQPENEDMLYCLEKLGKSKESGAVRHLICLDNTGCKWDYHNPNLRYLKNILPLLYYHDNYEFFYYYDSLGAHINEQSELPYYIITSHYLCLMSYDYEEAVLTADAGMMDMYSRSFERRLKMARPMLESMDVMENYMAAYISNEKIQNGNGEVFNMEAIPCLMPFMTKEILERCIITDVISMEEAMGLLDMDQHSLEKLNQQKSMSFFFSEEGVQQFLEEGRVGTVPSSIYRPLEPEDRVWLLERLYQALEEESITGYMVRSQLLSPLYHTHIEITDRGQTLFFVQNGEGKSKCISLNEKNTSNAFYDYMEFLKTSDFVYERTKMLDCLSGLLKKCKIKT